MKHFFSTLVILGLLIRAVPAYSQSAEDAKLKGETALNNGDLGQAIANFSEAVRLDPKVALAYVNRGHAYYQMREYDKAISDLNEAIHLDPKLVYAYNARGLAFNMKRNYGAAIADYTEAIRLDPKSAQGYYGRGGVYDDKREYDRAIADFNEAIRLDPKSAEAFSSRADSYEHKGDYDKAINDSIEAIRLDTKCARAHNSLGIAYDGYARAMWNADEETADALFVRASQHFTGPPRKLDAVQQQVPFDGSVEHFRAATKKLDRTHKSQLLFDYSAAAFKAAIDIQPDYDFGNNNLGVYYARRGEPGDIKLAEKHFRDALKVNRHYADAFNNLGIVLARQGKLDEAIASHRAGLEFRKSSASDHNNLCRVYMAKYDLDFKKGNSEKASADLENAVQENEISLKCNPNFLGSWLSREEIELKQKDLDAAARTVRRMMAIDAKSQETIQALYLYVGKCCQLGRADEAIEFLNQSLKVNGAAPEIYRARGLAYMQKGELLRAQQDFEQVLRLRPDFPNAKEALKEIRSRLANPKK
jgi:tetratricopeptide (TPR) repeat protein